MVECVTIGETCAVFAARQVGRLRYARDFVMRVGGAESTVAVAVARLGHTSGWISALGDDEFGQKVMSLMRGEGVDVSTVRLEEGMPTGVFVRERLPGGKARHFYYRSGSAFSALGPEDLDSGYIASARILHLTGITPALSDSCREMTLEAVRIAKDNGLTVTFDPNIRLRLWSAEEARKKLEPIMVQADFVLPSLEDVRALYGQGLTARDAGAILKQLGCGTVVLKCGEQGAFLFEDGDAPEYYPCDAVASPADLMGAGDAFVGGFIAGLLDDMDCRAAVRIGNRVAEYSVQLPGNIESLPTKEDLNGVAGRRTNVFR